MVMAEGRIDKGDSIPIWKFAKFQDMGVQGEQVPRFMVTQINGEPAVMGQPGIGGGLMITRATSWNDEWVPNVESCEAVHDTADIAVVAAKNQVTKRIHEKKFGLTIEMLLRMRPR